MTGSAAPPRALILAAIAAATAVAISAAAGPAAAAPAPSGRKVAVLEFRAGSAALPHVGMRMAGLLRRRTSLSIIDVEDARRMYGTGLDRDVARCGGGAACIAAIGAKLGAHEVLLIGVSRFGDVILTMQRIRVSDHKVLARVAESLAVGATPSGAGLLDYAHRIMPQTDFRRWGVIRIDANVPGATVIIGHRRRGMTPLAPVRVPAPATYPIAVTKPGYIHFEATVAVPPNAEVRVRPVLSHKRRWYQSWWVAAIAGTVVAGTVTTAVILSQSGNDQVPVTIHPF